MKQVLVIGGGAGGMMAAIAAADAGASVTLIEKNEKLGKKIYITGKGRCNVTNAGDMENLFENVVTNEKFLYSAFYTYTNFQLMDFIEEQGCKLKTERGNRVFPVSDHASDIIFALKRAMDNRKVKTLLNTTVKDLLIEEGEKPEITGVVLKDGKTLKADRVILATGGLSYPTTGSTGDGMKWAEKLGHTIKECRPSLVPFNIKEKWCQDLMGLSLKNVNLKVLDGNREIYDGFGEMLFTHFGISGPLVLSASSYYPLKPKGEIKAILDLKPALTEEQLDQRLLREFEENNKKQFRNSLGNLFPARLIPVMIELSGIAEDKKVYDITREERKAFLHLIKNLPMTVTGIRGFEEAIITKGGVAVKEINPSTMESKKISGLYMAGEMLDLDALTGGYNLQIAWSTGYLAGLNAAQEE